MDKHKRLEFKIGDIDFLSDLSRIDMDLHNLNLFVKLGSEYEASTTLTQTEFDIVLAVLNRLKKIQ